MTYEKQYTYVDLVKAKREGVRTALFAESNFTMSQIDDVADYHYPLPKVTRPRVVQDPHEGPQGMQWRMGEGGRLETRRPWNQTVWRAGQAVPTPERIAMWADLFANPTEEVEADA